MPGLDRGPAYLFVYGTLRATFDGPMAVWLRRSATPVGPATIAGTLYDIEGYPGLVPGPDGLVQGDVYAMADAAAILAVLDAYEECTADDPQPHEYRRERRPVQRRDGPVDAWVYVYAHEVTGFARIRDGDFLTGARPRPASPHRPAGNPLPPCPRDALVCAQDEQPEDRADDDRPHR